MISYPCIVCCTQKIPQIVVKTVIPLGIVICSIISTPFPVCAATLLLKPLLKGSRPCWNLEREERPLNPANDTGLESRSVARPSGHSTANNTSFFPEPQMCPCKSRQRGEGRLDLLAGQAFRANIPVYNTYASTQYGSVRTGYDTSALRAQGLPLPTSQKEAAARPH